MKCNHILALGIIFILSSCASIIHGPNQTVDFNSQPSGAKITIDGKEIGKTPQSVVLRRKGREKGNKSEKQSYDVKIELDGYYPYELKIKRETDGIFFLNIVLGGVVGLIIDAANGSMYKLTPDQVIAQMSKSTAYHRFDEDRIFFAVTLKADPNWEKIGELTKID